MTTPPAWKFSRRTTGSWCGPTSTEIVLNGRGVVMSQQNLANEIGTTVNGTDYVGLIERVLNNHLPDAHYTSVYNIDRELLWANIVASINAGYGCVFNIDVPPSNYPRGVKGSASPAYGGGEVFHYIAGMGYDDADPRAVWIADPGFRPFGYWVALDQLATMIPPKGYAYATAQPVVDDSVEAVMATNQEKLDNIERETVTQKSGSRSWFAEDGNLIDTPLGVNWNEDGNIWNQINILGHLAGVGWCVDAVKKVAAGNFGTGSFISGQPWLQQMAQSYCQALLPLEGVLKKIK